MVLLGFRTGKSEIVKDYMIETSKRFENKNLSKNPFCDFKLNIVENKDSRVYVLRFNHIWPDISLFWGVLIIGGLFALLVFKAVFGFWIALASALVVGFVQFWRSKFFFFIILKAGLKKKKFVGKIKLLTDKEVLSLFPF